MKYVVSSFLQLFSHKYGCEGKPGFNPEAALVNTRTNKPCTVAGFSYWAAQFSHKIHKIMYNAKGSLYSAASCSGYRKTDYPECADQLYLEY